MNCSLNLCSLQSRVWSVHFRSFRLLANTSNFNLISKTKLRSNYEDKNLSEKQISCIPLIQKISSRGHRFFRRRPIEVINHNQGQTMDQYIDESKYQAGILSDDETDISDSIQNKKEVRQSKTKARTDDTPHKVEQVRPSSQKTKEESVPDITDRKVFKSLNILEYEKANRKVKQFFEQGKSTMLRRKNDFFLVEGWRLLGEALMVGLKPHAIFFSRSRLLLNLIPTVAKTEEELADFLNLFPIYKTSYSVFELWSSLTTPPGIVAAFPMSKAVQLCETPKTEDQSFPLTVILDEIRDPSNLGSIIRTLVAVGVQKIIMTKGCCDIWDSKVLRASCGAHFHMHCVTRISWSRLESFLPSFDSVFLADSCRESYLAEDDPKEDVQSSSNKINLETMRDVAATGSDNHTVYSVGKDGSKLKLNNSYNNIDHLNLFSNVPLTQYSYDKLNFFHSERGNSVLIIGGETGLSNSAKKFALENCGVQVGIPLWNNIDSLNSSVAVGILVYEAQKQYRALLKSDDATKSVN